MGDGVAVKGLIAAVAASFAACWVAYMWGRRAGLFDRPDDDLKTHSRVAVPLGGAGILAGTQVGLVSVDAFDPALLVATALVWVVGVVDDVRGLSPMVRLVGAGVAAVVLVTLSGEAPNLADGLLWVLATIVLINAVNLLDGMDGLVALVTMTSLAGLWWFAVAQGTASPHIYLVLIAAVAGFLYWNLPPARMFLGDNGAYVVGVSLAWAAMRASPDRGSSLTALALIGVPLLDLAVTVVRRILAREPLMAGDRRHTYDRLRQAGWSDSAVLATMVLVQAVWSTVLLAVAFLVGDPAAVLTAIVLGTAGVAVLVVRWPLPHPE